jgi:hypothetical protein
MAASCFRTEERQKGRVSIYSLFEYLPTTVASQLFTTTIKLKFFQENALNMPSSPNPYSPLCYQRVFHQHHPRLQFEHCYFCANPNSREAAQWKGQLWADRLNGDIHAIYRQIEKGLLECKKAIMRGYRAILEID